MVTKCEIFETVTYEYIVYVQYIDVHVYKIRSF